MSIISLMPLEVIILPPAILVSLFFLYFLSFYDKNYNFDEIKIFVFLIAIYSFYSFNRFSNFGNDAVAHLFFFLCNLHFFHFQNEFFYKNQRFFGETQLNHHMFLEGQKNHTLQMFSLFPFYHLINHCLYFLFDNWKYYALFFWK